MSNLSQLNSYSNIIDNYLSGLFKNRNSLLKIVNGSLGIQGKHVRGVLSLLSCEAVSGNFNRAIPIAIGWELYHTASLIQDDIFDKSNMRRGKPTLNSEHDITVAILVSDVLLFEMHKMLAKYTNTNINHKTIYRVLEKLGDYSINTAIGEYEDVFCEKTKSNVKGYLDMIYMKTGSLIAASTSTGAIIGGGTKSEVKMLEEFGEKNGMAYQILDDLLDVTGDIKLIKKPIFSDIRNCKKNIVFIYAIQNADNKQKQFLSHLLGKKKLSRTEINMARKIFDETGAISMAEKLGQKYAQEGRKAISKLKQSSAKDKLLDMASILIKRHT